MPQFTKKAITESFLKLLSQKSFDKITIGDIVDDCGVSRNSFYYYYMDIFDLMDDVFKTETEKALKAKIDAAEWDDALISALQFSLLHRKQIANVYNSSCRDRVENYLIRVTEKVLNDYVEQQAKGLYTTAVDRSYIARFYTYALLGMLRELMDKGFKDDTEAVIRRVGTLMKDTVHIALINSDRRNSEFR